MFVEFEVLLQKSYGAKDWKRSVDWREKFKVTRKQAVGEAMSG